MENLLKLTNRVRLLLISVAIFVITGIVFFFSSRKEIKMDIPDKIQEEEDDKDKDEEDLSMHIETLLREIDSLTRQISDFEKVVQCEVTGNVHGSEMEELGVLSRKLQIIRSFMVFPSGRNDENYCFRVKNLKELKGKIGECMSLRSEYIKEAREFYEEKCFLEWAEELEGQWRGIFDALKSKATEIGALLSHCLSDFLFLASPREGAVEQYLKYFKFVIEVVMECQKKQPSGNAMKKVVSSLEFAEKELVTMGMIKREVLDRHRDEDEEEVDRKAMSSHEAKVNVVLDALLRQILVLDALLCVPVSVSLSKPHDCPINKDLRDLQDSMEFGKKEIEELRLQVHDLEPVQEESVGLLMAQFQQQMDLRITETWKSLEV